MGVRLHSRTRFRRLSTRLTMLRIVTYKGNHFPSVFQWKTMPLTWYYQVGSADSVLPNKCWLGSTKLIVLTCFRWTISQWTLFAEQSEQPEHYQSEQPSAFVVFAAFNGRSIKVAQSLTCLANQRFSGTQRPHYADHVTDCRSITRPRTLGQNAPFALMNSRSKTRF